MPGQYGSLAKAVFLTIDSAKVSGVALSEPEGRAYVSESFAEVTSQLSREAWIRDALECAKDLELPLVVVAEQWTPHGLSRAAYKSLNESWGLWQAAIEREHVGKFSKIKVHVVRVSPQTWRSAVFGKRRPRERKDLKQLAVVYANKQLGAPPAISDNIAEAMCIRVWAERASEVHDALAVKGKRKAA